MAMTEKENEFRSAVERIEKRISELGWDIPPTLYSLVFNHDLLRVVPETPDISAADKAFRDEVAQYPEGLTDFFQTEIHDDHLTDFLEKIVFPANVFGVVLAVEQVIVSSDDIEIPTDPKEYKAFCRNNPDVEEVRVTVGVTRDNNIWSLIRSRSHDNDSSVLRGDDLVDAYPQLLRRTLDDTHNTAN